MLMFPAEDQSKALALRTQPRSQAARFATSLIASESDMAPPKPVALAPEGNYVFSTPLGEGTFGTVVKATHKIAKEHVAVKVLEKKRMLQADEIEVRATPRAARKIARAPPRPPNLLRLAHAARRPRDPDPQAAQAPERRAALGDPVHAEADLPRDGVRGARASSSSTLCARAASPRTRAAASSARSSPASRTSTRSTWCTATSSPRTCCSTRTATS